MLCLKTGSVVAVMVGCLKRNRKTLFLKRPLKLSLVFTETCFVR